MKVTGRTKATSHGMVAVIFLLCLTACAGYPGFRDSDSYSRKPTLDLWVEETLVPYLQQQFSQHPRFKGQPVLLVRMQGENILPRIDDLTKQIRDKISDALLKKNGLNLAWRPAIKPWEHHQSLQAISCSDDSNIRYYIGIDAGLSNVKQNLYVKVRALNLMEHKWVSGFGKSWSGIPTRDQLDALSREHPDEYLLGLRPLPFSEGQPDMLAAYLARNLSCVLKQGEIDDLVVHVTPPAPGTPEMIRTTMRLLGRYLTRFREVNVTDDPNRANVTIISAVHSIDKHLYQVWISARHRQGEIYLPGAETEAYVELEPRDEAVSAVANREEAMSSIRPAGNTSEKPPIITSFNLLTPRDKGFCATESPWKSGAQRVVSNESLQTGSCLAVEMEVNQSAYVFLLGQDALGDLVRIYPSNCPIEIPDTGLLRPGERLRFPSLSEAQAAVLELDGFPGTERIYAVAITKPRLAAIFADRIEKIQDLCRAGKTYPEMLGTEGRQYPQERIQRWQNYLNWLSDNNAGLIEWREQRFQHAAHHALQVEGKRWKVEGVEMKSEVGIRESE